MSFKLKNPPQPQSSPPVNVLASGAIHIGSSTLVKPAGANNAPMFIAVLPMSQTAVCQSTTCNDNTCTCSGSFTVPQNRKVYALKAEAQCNGGGTFNITQPSTIAVAQPPSDCKAACHRYAELFSGIDVTDDATDGTLNFGASLASAGADLCLAGNRLKLLFTIQFTAD